MKCKISILLYNQLHIYISWTQVSRPHLFNPDPSILQKDNWLWEVLGQEEYIKVISHASRITEIKSEQLRYEARLNKNDF